ncbi:hypothetical protein EWE75_07500 [Sphingomonas populi]|uniref:Uncharacterized protein n=1 Tax=Sphingomonas populi TaxID=2484750 RepID=A0A4Q6Y5L0_9SPHN|nr:hypothetical protein [Sphingomonas populi]RZF65204.1 hypothetical protein EWE75_07500 [Sphingomonas populi]
MAIDGGFDRAARKRGFQIVLGFIAERPRPHWLTEDKLLPDARTIDGGIAQRFRGRVTVALVIPPRRLRD